MDKTPVDDNATDKSEVPKVLRSHNSKSKDDQKEKWMFEKHFGQIYALDEGPWEMRKLRKWYIDASKKGLMSLTVRLPPDAFMANKGSLWLDFSDLHAIYHRKKMDVNFFGAWCL
uniref:Uncharacterized protein n=1 Tax=Oryza sativa subsp. japonica TaxID=39947 RepID=Q2QW12_ORYSJ|nr:hypothetical protein LOC_Os12g10940 [Oryza sativa Japonica Group]